MSIIRMYRKSEDDVLTFREAWLDEEDGVVVVNHGVVGHHSSTQETQAPDADAAEQLMAAFESQATGDGYRVIPDEEQFWVVAQFALKTATGTERDRYLERKAKDSITAYLAWRGVGTVDRSEIANGRLNIYCLAPDPAKAVTAIKVCLREAKLDFTKLSIGVAPHDDLAAIKQKHGPRATTFTL
jgi:hypothetical protein